VDRLLGGKGIPNDSEAGRKPFALLMEKRREVMMARRLRQETTLKLKGIAQRLQVGSWTYVSKLLNAKPEPPASTLNLLLERPAGSSGPARAGS